MKKLMKNKWVWIGIAVIVAILIFTMSRSATNASSATDNEETAVVFVGELAESATASGQLFAAQEASLALPSSGIIAERLVDVGAAVNAGDLLVQLDTSALERNLKSAQADLLIAQMNRNNLIANSSDAELAAAQAALNSAKTKLDQRKAGPTATELINSEANVQAALANLQSASGRLTASYDVSPADILTAESNLTTALDQQRAAKDMWARLADCTVQADGSYICVAGDSDRMRNATLNVEAANAQVAAAQSRLNELRNPQSTANGTAQASVTAARAQYDAAVARHEALLLGSSAAAIAAAEADYANANASFDKLNSGPLSTDIATADIRVAQAEVTVREAELALANASLYAPFNGVVTAVYVNKGELASGIAVDLVNLDSLEVILTVDEVDIGQIELGQPAIVTLESWPDQEIKSSVTAIAPAANQNSSGIVAYDVHLQLDGNELPAKIGMTANAQLITANRTGILLVSNAAITADREAGTYRVNVLQVDADGNKTALPVTVTIGLKDNKHTQITSGLNEGDEVLIGALQIPTFQFGPGE